MAAEASQAVRRVLVVAADTLDGPEPVEEILRGGPGPVEVEVVTPAVEETQFRHLMGDVDEPARVARARLEASLDALRRNGVEATGTVGEADPVLAAEDVLSQRPADEVLIFEHERAAERWFEHGLDQRARETLSTPLRIAVLRAGDDGEAHVVETERGEDVPDDSEHEVRISANLPRFSRADLVGMVIGVVGTIVVIILAAAGPGPQSAAGAASILIAIGISLINMAHVVGLTLFESVHYRGGFARFFRYLALTGTPAAVLANLLILLLG
ncbi:MAG TPA: hypothetical protein VKA36_04305 [Solirubrobacterales bacterium]|nr:hypothetical protein [Solirubrobacterales bacterium]